MATPTTRDGIALHLRHWPHDAARGTVLLVHGLGEHSGRYEALAAVLVADGWAVWGYDQRGHGRSGGARGAIADADSLCEDLAQVVDQVQDLGHSPLVLLGHSMGGLVAARFVAEGLSASPRAWWRPVDALVLSSPALDPGMTPAQRLLLAVLGRVAPHLAVSSGLKPEWLSHDPEVVRADEQDPLVHDRITPRLARFIVDGGEMVRARAAHWTTPTLLLWAGADRCVAPSGSAAFAAAAPPAVVRHQLYPALAHEIFNEPERAPVLAALTHFLRRLA